ncbi:MAG TPA: hypothetical protein VII47_06280 [Actinomycetota bacterium]
MVEAEYLADAGLALRSREVVRADLAVRAETRFRRGDLSGARDDLTTALASPPALPAPAPR